MQTIDTSDFLNTSLGALLVISGVVIKNTAGQLKIKDNTPALIGMIIFAIGWIQVARSLAKDNKNSSYMYVASAAIFLSAAAMRMYMDDGKKPPMILPAIFAISWLILGSMNNSTNVNLGVLGSISVIASMFFILPWQRDNNVIDGPGLPLFVIGWVFVVLSKSLRSELLK